MEMNPSPFQQAIEEAFPNLNPELRAEIHDKVSQHIFEVLKDKVFANDSEGLQKLDYSLKEETDEKKRSEVYMKQIMEKLLSLPAEKQKEIDQELNEELTRVMHEVYKAYE
jgi:hypothetical protein